MQESIIPDFCINLLDFYILSTFLQDFSQDKSVLF